MGAEILGGGAEAGMARTGLSPWPSGMAHIPPLPLPVFFGFLFIPRNHGVCLAVHGSPAAWSRA